MNLIDKILCVVCGGNLAIAGLGVAVNDTSGAAVSFAMAAVAWLMTYWQPGERE